MTLTSAGEALGLTDPTLLREAVPIGGVWVEAGGEGVAVTNPATGVVLGHVPKLGQADTARAIVAAQVAQPGWAALLAGERSRILRRLFELMTANREDLARIMTAEQGKPLAESLGEIEYAASFIEWFAEEAKRVYGDVIPPNVPGRKILVIRQPIGVFAAITPWNFPAAMITRKAGPAWAAGCAGVIRPASQTPFSAIALAVLAERAGLPRGVQHRDRSSDGDWSRTNEQSAGAQTELYGFDRGWRFAACAMRPDHQKDLNGIGGNAPFLVFDDADLDRAVEGAVVAKFRNGGQACTAVNRFLVQDDIYDRFVAALTARVAALKVGPGIAADSVIGPMIDAVAVAKVEEHIADAVAQGARLVTGGTRHALGGSYFTPTLLAGVSRKARMFEEETFGPVASVFRFSSEDEGVALANDSDFGLAAYVYTRDLGRALRVADALESGMVGVNEGLISTAVAPFGGVKASGLGREGSHYGMDDYLEIKYIALGGLEEQAA